MLDPSGQLGRELRWYSKGISLLFGAWKPDDVGLLKEVVGLRRVDLWAIGLSGDAVEWIDWQLGSHSRIRKDILIEMRTLIPYMHGRGWLGVRTRLQVVRETAKRPGRVGLSVVVTRVYRGYVEAWQLLADVLNMLYKT